MGDKIYGELIMNETETLKPVTRNLTLKQQKFVDCFAGNIKEAAEKAGLTYQYCRRLATKSNILELIKKRQETEIRPCDIATRQQRQEFWTQIMNDTGKPLPDRLRASELLGKSEADFTDNINNNNTPEPIKLTDEDREELRRMAIHLNKTGTDDTHSNNTADGTK